MHTPHDRFFRRFSSLTQPQTWVRALAVGTLSASLIAGCGDRPDDLVSSAKQLMEKKDFRAASIQLKTALQKDANHKEARYYLGTSLKEIGDLAGAEKELRRAVELGYDKNLADIALARVVFAQGKVEDFKKEFGELKLATPQENAELKSMLGSALLSRGDLAGAEKAFGESIALQAGYMPARIGQARLTAAKGDVQGAEKMVDALLAESPKEREALSLKASILGLKGDREGMLAVHRKLVEYNPTGLAERYGLSIHLLERNMLDEAATSAAELVKLAPNDPRTLHVQALVAYQRKEFTPAQEFAVKALSRAPNFVPAQLIAGAAAYQLKSYQQAIQYLTSVTAAQKNNSFAHQLLVASLLAAGETQRASRQLKEALQQVPNDSKLLLMAGEIAARERNMSEASKYFELSAGQQDKSGLASTRLGQLRLAEGKEDEGLRILEESAKAGDKTQSDLALVTHHLQRGEPDKAAKWIDSIVKKEPDSPVGPTLRGIMALAKKDPEGARKQFDAALLKDGAFVPALGYLAQLDLQEKKAADYKRRFDQALEKNPTSQPVALTYARILLAQREPADVVAAPLRTVIKKDPTAVDVRLALISVLRQGTDPKQALTAAQEAVAAVPGNPALMLALGQSQVASGDNTQALTTFAEVAKLQPRNADPLWRIAQVHTTAGDYPKALDALKRVLEIQPDLLAARRAEAIVHVRAKEFDKALEIARDVRKKNPKETFGHELEAAVYVSMEKWPEAAESLQAAFKEKPSTSMMVKLHGALAQAGKKDRAAALASDWLGKNPKDVTARNYLAERATENKDMATAVRLYREAVAIQPKNPMLLNNLAWAAGQANDPKALSYAEEANTLAPNSPPIMDTLGWMLVQKGDAARGLDLLQKASTAAPQAFPIRMNLARALVKAGRKDDARKELEFLKSQGDKFGEQAEVDSLLKQL